MGKGIITLNKERGIRLTPYIVTHEKKMTFLLCPGGGYTNCEEAESAPVATVFNQLGYNAFILQYSVGKHYKWPYPLEDFDAAMEYMIQHASEYHVDTEHIVAAGFSAGGHVVSVAASIAKIKPFAAILCYGLTSLETLAFCAPDAPDACSLVNHGTVPCFLASSRTDWIVPVTDTTNLITAFQKHFVDYEAHIYGYALHGFSVGESAGAVGPLFCSRVGNWVKDSLEWLDELMSGRYKSIKECAAYNDLYATAYSTMNSCRALFSNKAAAKIVKHKFPIQYMIYTAASKKVGSFTDTVSMRQILELVKTDAEVILKMDTELQKIPFTSVLEEGENV